MDIDQGDHGHKREERNAPPGAAPKKRVSETHSLMSGRNRIEKRVRSQSRDRSAIAKDKTGIALEAPMLTRFAVQVESQKQFATDVDTRIQVDEPKVSSWNTLILKKQYDFRNSKVCNRLQSINPEYQT